MGVAQQRNPGATRDSLEDSLRRHLGVRRVLWLGEGIAGDDTHGHVDDVARFVAPDTVVAAWEQDPADANHKPLAANLARLRTMRDLRGRPLRVVALPMPRPVRFDGVRLPASYLNFYIANRSVLVPTFNDPADRVALDRLAALFPGPRGDRHPRGRPHPRSRGDSLRDAAGTGVRSTRGRRRPRRGGTGGQRPARERRRRRELRRKLLGVCAAEPAIGDSVPAQTPNAPVRAR